jgi:hypothetical protein
MSEFTTINFARSAHITRGPELISIGDGDIVSFTPDIVVNGADPSMIVDSGTYASDAGDLIEAGDRIMMWGRISSSTGDLSGPMRWLSYFTENSGAVGNAGNSGGGSIAVLRDAFSPRVTYDKQNNRLGLWFWTNVNLSYTDALYDPAELFTIVSSANKLTDAFDGAKKVLCYAVGSFYHKSVSGGEITGLVGTPSAFANDIVPIFNTPQIISYGDDESGVVLDNFIFDGQIISPPLRSRWLSNKERYTEDSDLNPDVPAPIPQDQLQIVKGELILPRVVLTVDTTVAITVVPVAGTPTFVYIKITDYCEGGAAWAIEQFNAERPLQDIEDDFYDDNIKWILLCTVEVVDKDGGTSVDSQYVNNSSLADGWGHWYIETYTEGPIRIYDDFNDTSRTYQAKITGISAGTGETTVDIFGDGFALPATREDLVLNFPAGFDIRTGKDREGDEIWVQWICGQVYLFRQKIITQMMAGQLTTTCTSSCTTGEVDIYQNGPNQPLTDTVTATNLNESPVSALDWVFVGQDPDTLQFFFIVKESSLCCNLDVSSTSAGAIPLGVDNSGGDLVASLWSQCLDAEGIECEDFIDFQATPADCQVGMGPPVDPVLCCNTPNGTWSLLKNPNTMFTIIPDVDFNGFATIETVAYADIPAYDNNCELIVYTIVAEFIADSADSPCNESKCVTIDVTLDDAPPCGNCPDVIIDCYKIAQDMVAGDVVAEGHVEPVGIVLADGILGLEGNSLLIPNLEIIDLAVDSKFEVKVKAGMNLNALPIKDDVNVDIQYTIVPTFDNNCTNPP